MLDLSIFKKSNSKSVVEITFTKITLLLSEDEAHRTVIKKPKIFINDLRRGLIDFRRFLSLLKFC